MRFISSICLLFWAYSLGQAQFVTHGPVMGGTTDHSIRMYLRSDSVRLFSIELDTQLSFANPISFNNTTDAALDYSVITDLTGLQADTRYYYRLRFSGQLDTVKMGYFRTFPTEGQASNFTFVAGSCQETANMKVYDVMPTYNPLFMLHTGDFTYPSYQLPNSYPSVWSTIPWSYRKRYEELVMKDKLLPYIPMAYMPDDDDNFGVSRTHHISSGYTGGPTNATNFFITSTISQIERENCLRGYRLFFPGYPTVDTSEGHYHRFKVANAEFFVLDARSMADPLFNAYRIDSATNLWVFDPPANHTILGTNQMNWLLNSLSNSTAQWKFIVSGVPFNPKIEHIIRAGLQIQNLVFNIGGENGTGFRLSTSFAGYWGGYPNDIKTLTEHITNQNITGVLMISGDTHHNVMDDGKNSIYPELNASGLSVTTTELAYQIAQYAPLLGQPSVTDSLWNGGGNGLHNTNFNNAFGKVDVYGADSVRYCIVDEDNVTLNCFTIFADGTVYNPLEIKYIANAQKGEMKIFPNPTAGDFQLQLRQLPQEGAYKLLILNTLGQVLYQNLLQVGNKEEYLSPCQLPTTMLSGHYFAVLSDNAGNIVALQPFVLNK